MTENIDALRIQLDAALGAVFQMEQHFMLESQRGAVRHRDRHGYVPYPPKDFLVKMCAASRLHQAIRGKRASRFLDVGCGVGTKVFLAAHLFTHAVGLEIDPRLLRIARTLDETSLRNSSFIRGDALAYDDYARYDVLFLYRPFRDDDRQAALERRIAEQTRAGTIIVASVCRFGELPPMLRPAEILPDVFLRLPRNRSMRRFPRALQEEIEALSRR
jgi:SAM-dependent methyltransferase